MVISRWRYGLADCEELLQGLTGWGLPWFARARVQSLPHTITQGGDARQRAKPQNRRQSLQRVPVDVVS
jgi:hypothetical protein